MHFSVMNKQDACATYVSVYVCANYNLKFFAKGWGIGVSVCCVSVYRIVKTSKTDWSFYDMLYYGM